MDLAHSIQLLDDIAAGDYKRGIVAILDDPDEYLAFKRVGRLAAVSIKAPFSQAAPYDPELPFNWAQSGRQWGVVWPLREEDIALHRREFHLLSVLAEEWNRPVWSLAEFNIFYSLCRRASPFICGESETVQKATKAAAELKGAGGSAKVVSPELLLTLGANEIALDLARNVPELADHLAIITGFTLILCFYGQKKACTYLQEFLASYDASLDHGSTH